MSNELKLSLENFQSISQGELVFHKGTTVIVGQSNSGKTATFRALKACLSNPMGSQRFIKKGRKQASVSLEYEGNQIIWKRTPKESSYIINNEPYVNTGKSNAFKIVEDTGFVRDDNDVIMNIEEELQLPFPFGISKSDLFKLYENVFCISDSAIILKSAKECEEKIKDDISALELNIVKNQNKLEELQKFKEECSLTKLNEMKGELIKVQQRYELLRDGLDVIKAAIKAQNIDLSDILEKTFESYLESYTNLVTLKKDIQKLQKLHVLNKSLPLDCKFENHLKSYEELISLAKERDILRKLKELNIPIVTFENRLTMYNDLKKYSEELKDIKTNIQSKKIQLKKAENNLKVLNDKLSEFKVCPLCHRPLNTGEQNDCERK